MLRVLLSGHWLPLELSLIQAYESSTVDRKEMIHKARLGIHVGDNTRELPFDQRLITGQALGFIIWNQM